MGVEPSLPRYPRASAHAGLRPVFFRDRVAQPEPVDLCIRVGIAQSDGDAEWFKLAFDER